MNTPVSDARKNSSRFKGFADLYDAARPSCPEYVVCVLTRYLGYSPRTVVDIGCGTGLSTRVWKNAADSVIGIEPSEDMIAQATGNNTNNENIKFIQSFSDETGLDDGAADIITCSQSFHWMEPDSTIREISRVLKSGGVFAAYDYDLPPICGTDIELSYRELFRRVADIRENLRESIESHSRNPKDKHIENLQNSGYFRYTREILFSNTENFSAKRFYQLALSQGEIQILIKKDPSLIAEELKIFREKAENAFGFSVLPVEFCYRMRMAVRK